VGVFGDLENPQFGVRAVTDDPERGSAILKGFNHAFDLGIPVVPASVDDGYGLATDATAARALAGDDAGLADSDAFRDAVPGADDATLVGWVDLAAVQQQVPDTGDVRAEDYEAVEALGFTSTPTDEGSRFVLRLTTR
jgi:hypothetical protein